MMNHNTMINMIYYIRIHYNTNAINLINNNDARTNDDENKSQSAAVARIQLLSARASSLLYTTGWHHLDRIEVDYRSTYPHVQTFVPKTRQNPCAREWRSSKRRCVDPYGPDEHIAYRLFSGCPYRHQN